jgi:hypothetical protein
MRDRALLEPPRSEPTAGLTVGLTPGLRADTAARPVFRKSPHIYTERRTAKVDPLEFESPRSSPHVEQGAERRKWTPVLGVELVLPHTYPSFEAAFSGTKFRFQAAIYCSMSEGARQKQREHRTSSAQPDLDIDSKRGSGCWSEGRDWLDRRAVRPPRHP